MNRIYTILAALVVLTSCEKLSLDMQDGETSGSSSTQSTQTNKNKKNFTFTIKGDFGAPTFTRAYMSANGTEMTDLWVFDYMDGVCVQSLHQTNGDDDWGTPKMALDYGSHHVYFVASRGMEPSVDEDKHEIVWGNVRDTFWKDYEVTVVSSSNGNRAVTLDRMVAKLRITLEDEIPEGCNQVAITPDTWYYGLDYTTGKALYPQTKDRIISVASAVGKANQALSIFGFSDDQEWETDVEVVATDGSGKRVGAVTLEGAKFLRNRSTEYSGKLFYISGSNVDVSLSEEWLEPKTETF